MKVIIILIVVLSMVSVGWAGDKETMLQGKILWQKQYTIINTEVERLKKLENQLLDDCAPKQVRKDASDAYHKALSRWMDIYRAEDYFKNYK